MTKLSTFFGLSSWISPDKLGRIEEALCGVGGGPRLVELEGVLFMGKVVLEDDDDVGAGGKSDRELSGGGGGNCGGKTSPGCHFALVFTAGGDVGAGNLDPSMQLDAGRGERAEFPGK